MAAQKGHFQIVQFLFDAGANKDQAAKTGATAAQTGGGGDLPQIHGLVRITTMQAG